MIREAISSFHATDIHLKSLLHSVCIMLNFISVKTFDSCSKKYKFALKITGDTLQSPPFLRIIKGRSGGGILDSIKTNVGTLKVLWGSGMLCAILAMASLFACTPVHTQTVEKIESHSVSEKKACPYPALSDAKICVKESAPKTI
jgi:hypothetical protein